MMNSDTKSVDSGYWGNGELLQSDTENHHVDRIAREEWVLYSK